MKLSVIVASHNRSKVLGTLLEVLGKQQMPDGSDFEVIVIDNNSSDATKDTCEAFVRRRPERFHYVYEKRQGKSQALNTGIRAAQGDVLVFTDDDCVPDAQWLRSITGEFVSDCSLHVLGGRVELYCDDDKPVTIRTSRERIAFSSSSQLFSLIAGCNMAIRRGVFESVGGFDPALGPGTRMAAAEDVELLYRAFTCGFKIVYSPDVLVYHNHGRRTDAQVQALRRDYVVGRGAFYCKHILRGDLQILKMAYWEVSSLVRRLVQVRFSGESAREQKALLWDLIGGLGYITSSLRQLVRAHLPSRP